MRIKAFFIFAFSLFFLTVAPSFAEDGKTAKNDIDLVASPKVELKSDLSLGVLTRLFGNSVSILIGNDKAKVDGKETFFSGLIVNILDLLNLAAMVYVSAMIIYMWGVFAVTTAHAGEKLGGGVYNSLWIPVRHAMSFSLTVPVFNGLSLIQVAIILCAGLSINFANSLWNFAADRLVKDTSMSISLISYREEARNAEKMLPIMFRSSVVQRIMLDVAKKENKEPGGKESPWEKEYPNIDAQNTAGLQRQEYPINFKGQIDPNGRLIRIDDYRNGKAIVLPRVLGNMRYSGWSAFLNLWPSKTINSSTLAVDFPRWMAYKREIDKQTGQANQAGQALSTTTTKYNEFDEKKYDEILNQYGSTVDNHFIFRPNDSSLEHEAYKKAADRKILEIVKLWERFDEAALHYLNSKASAGDSCSIVPSGGKCNPKEEAENFLSLMAGPAIAQYAAGVSASNKKLSKELDNEKERQKRAARALGLVNGESRFGWITAGLFPFIYASMQQAANSASSNKSYVYNGNDTGMGGAIAELEKASKNKAQELSNKNYASGILNSSSFLVDNLHKSKNYISTVISFETNNLGPFKELGNNIVSAFYGTPDKVKETKGGILGAVLEEAGSKNPILVIQSFGQRLMDAATTTAVALGGLSLLVGTWGVFFACLGLIITGAFFAYVVPLIPVIFWGKAIISWVFMVIEAMVAAPFWACSHALPEGTGFAGQHARRGYMLFLDVIARPALLVLGAVFAFIVAQVSGLLIYKLFNIWFVNVFGVQNIGILADICYSIIIMGIIYYIFYTMFTKGVNYMPEHVLAWCGGVSPGGLRDEEGGTQQIVFAGGTLQGAKQIPGQSKLGSVMSLASKK